MKAAFTALVAIALFIVAFVLFILAPLIMMIVVGVGMWAGEGWRRRDSSRAIMLPVTGRALPRAAGSTRETGLDEPAFGFGALAGEDL